MQRFPGRHRPALSTAKLSLLVSLYLLAVLNCAFWSRGVVVFAGHEVKLSLLAVVLLLAHTMGLLLFSNRFVFKPVLIFFIFVAAAAAYSVDELGVLMDSTMISNTVTATVADAGRFLTGAFMKHMFVYAGLPSLVVMVIVVKRVPPRQQINRTAANMTACLLVATAILYVNYASYAPVFREKQDFMAVINPVAPMASSVRLLRRAMRETDVIAEAPGTDAVVALHCEQPNSRC